MEIRERIQNVTLEIRNTLQELRKEREVQRHRTPPPPAPRFNGTDPAGWISKVQTYFDYFHTTTNDRLQLVGLLFDHPASDWFRYQRRNNYIRTWEEFLDAVQQRFDGGSINSQVQDRTLLVKIHSMEYRISCEVLEWLFSRFGILEDVEILDSGSEFHSRIRFRDRDSAIKALAYDGRDIYDGCCRIELLFDDRISSLSNETEPPTEDNLPDQHLAGGDEALSPYENSKDVEEQSSAIVECDDETLQRVTEDERHQAASDSPAHQSANVGKPSLKLIDIEEHTRASLPPMTEKIDTDDVQKSAKCSNQSAEINNDVQDTNANLKSEANFNLEASRGGQTDVQETYGNLPAVAKSDVRQNQSFWRSDFKGGTNYITNLEFPTIIEMKEPKEQSRESSTHTRGRFQQWREKETELDPTKVTIPDASSIDKRHGLGNWNTIMAHSSNPGMHRITKLRFPIFECNELRDWVKASSVVCGIQTNQQLEGVGIDDANGTDVCWERHWVQNLVIFCGNIDAHQVFDEMPGAQGRHRLDVLNVSTTALPSRDGNRAKVFYLTGIKTHSMMEFRNCIARSRSFESDVKYAGNVARSVSVFSRYAGDDGMGTLSFDPGGGGHTSGILDLHTNAFNVTEIRKWFWHSSCAEKWVIAFLRTFIAATDLSLGRKANLRLENCEFLLMHNHYMSISHGSPYQPSTRAEADPSHASKVRVGNKAVRAQVIPLAPKLLLKRPASSYDLPFGSNHDQAVANDSCHALQQTHVAGSQYCAEQSSVASSSALQNQFYTNDTGMQIVESSKKIVDGLYSVVPQLNTSGEISGSSVSDVFLGAQDLFDEMPIRSSNTKHSLIPIGHVIDPGGRNSLPLPTIVSLVFDPGIYVIWPNDEICSWTELVLRSIGSFVFDPRYAETLWAEPSFLVILTTYGCTMIITGLVSVFDTGGKLLQFVLRSVYLCFRKGVFGSSKSVDQKVFVQRLLVQFHELRRPPYALLQDVPMDSCWVLDDFVIFDPGGYFRGVVFELHKGVDKRAFVQWFVQVSRMLADFTSITLSMDPKWMIGGVALAYGLFRIDSSIAAILFGTYFIWAELVWVFDPGGAAISALPEVVAENKEFLLLSYELHIYLQQFVLHVRIAYILLCFSVAGCYWASA